MLQHPSFFFFSSQSGRCGNNGSYGGKKLPARSFPAVISALVCGEAKRVALGLIVALWSPSRNMDLRPSIDSEPRANICVECSPPRLPQVVKKKKRRRRRRERRMSELLGMPAFLNLDPQSPGRLYLFQLHFALSGQRAAVDGRPLGGMFVCCRQPAVKWQDKTGAFKLPPGAAGVTWRARVHAHTDTHTHT